MKYLLFSKELFGFRGEDSNILYFYMFTYTCCKYTITVHVEVGHLRSVVIYAYIYSHGKKGCRLQVYQYTHISITSKCHILPD